MVPKNQFSNPIKPKDNEQKEDNRQEDEKTDK